MFRILSLTSRVAITSALLAGLQNVGALAAPIISISTSYDTPRADVPVASQTANVAGGASTVSVNSQNFGAYHDNRALATADGNGIFALSTESRFTGSTQASYLYSDTIQNLGASPTSLALEFLIPELSLLVAGPSGFFFGQNARAHYDYTVAVNGLTVWASAATLAANSVPDPTALEYQLSETGTSLGLTQTLGPSLRPFYRSNAYIGNVDLGLLGSGQSMSVTVSAHLLSEAGLGTECQDFISDW